MWVPLIGMFLWNNDISTALRDDTSLLVSLVGGSFILGIIGIWDDLVGVRAIIKLLAQIAAALVIYFSENPNRCDYIAYLWCVEIGFFGSTNYSFFG